MRHLFSSFLALHWAVVFALLAFICIDGSRGMTLALSVMGLAMPSAELAYTGNSLVAAPLATAFLVVAVLFCWAFVEIFVNDGETPEADDGIIRIAFIAAAGVLSLILIGGAARGFGGVFVVVAVHLAALLTSYIAILGERWVAVAREPGAQEARAAARGMARGAAHSSMLARFSGRAEDRTTGGRR